MMKGISKQVMILLVVSVFGHSCEAQMVSFFINCGTNSSVNIDGRKWIGDTSSDSNITLTSPGSIEASTTVFNGDPTYAPLYKTARVFTDALSYTFRVPQGNYFLRVHYHPFSFPTLSANANDSYFAVEANGIKLVSEFNVHGQILSKNTNLGGNFSHLMKEYLCLDVSVIVVRFVPSKGSFGFVNGIEIVPIEKMFVDLARRVGTEGGKTSMNLSGRWIETMYRLNVGGSSIKPSQDQPFWRSWEADSSYMINSDAGSETRNTSGISYSNSNAGVAPLLVYETARILSNTGVMDKRFNMSWKLEIDPDFEYLIRLHFCEFIFEEANQRIFRIYIDNKTAESHFDIYVRSGGTNRAYHEDYIDSISSKSNHIWIQLGPETSSGSSGTDALLNGLEVFKMSKNNNLAYVERYTNLGINKSTSLILWVGIGVGLACITFLVTIYLFFFRKTKNKAYQHTNSTSYQHQNTQFGIRFSLIEIKELTNNFDEGLVIGEGGFGKVYKGSITETTFVAIKRSDPQSQQGLSEFETEIIMLSKLRHRHLVSLIGFCDEQSEMILVYEYMANGTLRSHLFGGDLPPLSWKKRLQICIGAARGLHYLLTGLDRAIIHRDVKTTNILLDHNLLAKMSDFGLSKTGPEFDHTHVSTQIKGSFGYLDPEYFRMQHLTEKSDVYSFGVVLFEVLCARSVIDPELPKDEINLAEWAMRMIRERSIESIVDSRIKLGISRESLIKYGEIAEKCVGGEGKKRPTMGEVLWHLENVLQIHEAWMCGDGGDRSIAIDDEIEGEKSECDLQERDPFDPMVVGIDDFSQMIRLQGR